jgi:tRNA 2-thiocytidine biosynthesis protein TtcA
MSDPDRIGSFLLKPFARACKEFALLSGGDRIAVAVSGGKDSRTMLELLLKYRERVPFHYDLIALHIDGTAADLPGMTDVLTPWFESLGVEHRSVPLELPSDEPLPLNCFRCSWNRRKALFHACDDLKCNKLALGHNADDAAVTTLINLMFTGRLETLEVRLSFFQGRIDVIRPLIYIPAKDVSSYATAAGYPDAPECAQGADSRRRQVEDLLRGFGSRQSQVRANLWRASRSR